MRGWGVGCGGQGHVRKIGPIGNAATVLGEGETTAVSYVPIALLHLLNSRWRHLPMTSSSRRSVAHRARCAERGVPMHMRRVNTDPLNGGEDQEPPTVEEQMLEAGVAKFA
jgi:hypothetical protein